MAATSWSRAAARRALSTAHKRKSPAKSTARKPRRRTYAYDTLKILISVWRLAGILSGKGLSATKAGPLLQELELGLQGRGQTRTGPRVPRSGHGRSLRPNLAGEFAMMLTARDVFTGWTENVAVRNGAHKWVLDAADKIVARLPFPMLGLDTENGGEFINHALVNWAGDKDVYFSRSRPCKSNDNAHVEQKNARIGSVPSEMGPTTTIDHHGNATVRQYFRLRARDPFACAAVCRPIGGHRTLLLLSHYPRASRSG